MKVVAGGFPKRLAESLQALDGDRPLQLLQHVVDIVSGSDSYTAGHATRVADIATVLARITDCTSADIDLVQRAALVHDIGKIGVPEKVLRKQGPLTREERHLIDLHPIFGASILSRVREAADLVSIVLHHHERWDGTGYPGKLSMTDIPLASRIIAVADSFDAMTSYRTYGPALTSEQALAELRRCAETQFEPRLVDAMHDAYSFGLVDRRVSNVMPQAVGALG